MAWRCLHKDLACLRLGYQCKIDFLMEQEGGVTLVEVKANTGNAKASSEVLKSKNKYPGVRGLIKLGNYNIGRIENRLTIPYYLAFLLQHGIA